MPNLGKVGDIAAGLALGPEAGLALNAKGKVNPQKAEASLLGGPVGYEITKPGFKL